MLIAAAVLWSTGGVLVRILQQATGLGLEEPPLTPLQIAFYRSLFAGLGLLPMVKWSEVRFRTPMLFSMLSFGFMTGLYLSALGHGSAANAILLQNSAPVWVYLIGVFLLGHASDRRSLRSIVLGMLGACVIVVGNWPRGLGPDETAIQGKVLLMATGSGVGYALVILFLSQLKGESAAWLTVLNLIGSSVIILGFILVTQGAHEVVACLTTPTLKQFLFLAVFGMVQMAIPYYLFARGLRVVSPQEAGIITLLEPLLMPIWAFLIAPHRDTPTVWTVIGGLMLLAALAWRYLPVRSVRPGPENPADVAA